MAFINLAIRICRFGKSLVEKLLKRVFALIAEKRLQGILSGAEVAVEDAERFRGIAALEGGVGRLGKCGVAIEANEWLHAGVDVVAAEVENAKGHLLTFESDIGGDASA